MKRRHHVNSWAVLMMALLVICSPGSGQEATSVGPPDLEGIFMGRQCVGEGSLVCPELSREGATEVLTARAMAFSEAFDELAAPKYDCAPATLPGLFGDPYAFQVNQQPNRVTLSYEKDDIVRTVWLEGHDHPAPPTGAFFVHGHSTGRYEDNQLVVETTRFAFDPTGIAGDFISAPSSTQKRLVERYYREGERLRMDLTVEDPIFLRHAITYVMEWRPADRPLALPWACDPEASRRNLQLVPTKYPQDPPIVRR
ncbi:MAG: hypothetical protein VYE68_10540 [Acidobacteriota bacterium]|nr:hypothetical protein [Acidobacteriota bacterium]